MTSLVAMWLAPWQLTLLLGWDIAASILLAWVWLSVGGYTAKETAASATQEDDTRAGSELLLVGASLASLLGVGFDLARASQSSGFERGLLIAVGLLTVVLSWAVVHTTYALRYAHEYYTAPLGGIDFKSDALPDYQDFAYIAFTVGMTFQVSDTDVQRRLIRRTVLRHALLSYLFGAVILAVTINVIASLFE